MFGVPTAESKTKRFSGPLAMSIPLSFAARVLIPQDVLHQELDGESVILNVESGRYFGLDAVGNRMWCALTEAESIEHACKVLLAEFDVDEQKLRSDLGKLIGELSEHGLLSIEETQSVIEGNEVDKSTHGE